MSIRSVRTPLMATLVLWTAAVATSQQPPSTASLTNSAVEELTATATIAADHLRLHDHFVALAERYAADAKGHTAMALAYRGQTRPLTRDARARCDRLAALAKQSAEVAGQLAVHHGRLAGRAQLPPAAPPATERATAPDVLADEQARTLAATARTAAEHGRLQKHFIALNSYYEADHDHHRAMARAYRRNPDLRLHRRAFLNCERLARVARASATATYELAMLHERIAAGTG